MHFALLFLNFFHVIVFKLYWTIVVFEKYTHKCISIKANQFQSLSVKLWLFVWKSIKLWHFFKQEVQCICTSCSKSMKLWHFFKRKCHSLTLFQEKCQKECFFGNLSNWCLSPFQKVSENSSKLEKVFIQNKIELNLKSNQFVLQIKNLEFQITWGDIWGLKSLHEDEKIRCNYSRSKTILNCISFWNINDPWYSECFSFKKFHAKSKFHIQDSQEKIICRKSIFWSVKKWTLNQIKEQNSDTWKKTFLQKCQ